MLYENVLHNIIYYQCNGFICEKGKTPHYIQGREMTRSPLYSLYSKMDWTLRLDHQSLRKIIVTFWVTTGGQKLFSHCTNLIPKAKLFQWFSAPADGISHDRQKCGINASNRRLKKINKMEKQKEQMRACMCEIAPTHTVHSSLWHCQIFYD